MCITKPNSFCTCVKSMNEDSLNITRYGCFQMKLVFKHAVTFRVFFGAGGVVPLKIRECNFYAAKDKNLQTGNKRKKDTFFATGGNSLKKPTENVVGLCVVNWCVILCLYYDCIVQKRINFRHYCSTREFICGRRLMDLSRSC